MMRKAFTITELLVAVGLLAVVLTISGVVFSYSIDAQRASTAQAEIMRNLRAITDQLNADFAGHYPSGGVFRGFDPANAPGPYRADSIGFFTTGNFQTTNLYNNDVKGNLAWIYYGQSKSPDYTATDLKGMRNKILVRRQTIITSDMTLGSMDSSWENREYKQGVFFEIIADYDANQSDWLDEWGCRPDDVNDVNDFSMYLVKGVGNFSVQFYKEIDPNGTIKWWPDSDEGDFPINYNNQPYPYRAIKFNFTLYDSDGIIKDGKRFEHIVYLKQ